MMRPVYAPYRPGEEPYWLSLDDDTGEEIYPRQLVQNGTCSQPSGRMRVTFFRARTSDTVTTVRTYSGSTAAGASPTLCRVGIYDVDPATYALTLAAGIANDVTLWDAVNTEYESALTAAWDKRAGRLYAVGFLCVTAAAAPTTSGTTTSSVGGALFIKPIPLAGFVDGQADLPAAVALAALTGTGNAPYAELAP